MSRARKVVALASGAGEGYAGGLDPIEKPWSSGRALHFLKNTLSSYEGR
jgi:hypothetical protein